jgi:hypothetical protein
MSNISDVSANVPLLKNSYKRFVSLGEGAKADDFILSVSEYPDLKYLVQATQLPELRRDMIESRGPHGVYFNQQGNFKNAGDITITFKEVISGKAYEALADWVLNKKYLTVTIALLAESAPDTVTAAAAVMEDCWLELDAADLSVEDGTTLVKPTGTLHYNWHNRGSEMDPGEVDIWEE